MAILFKIPITYTMIYGKKANSPETYLSGLNRSKLIKCALFLFHNQEKWTNTNQFCENFFSQENNQLANELWTKVANLSFSTFNNEVDSIFPSEYSIISKHSCLELLRICFSLSDNQEKTSNKRDFEIGVFQALLSINETQNELCFDEVEKLPEPISSAYLILMTTLPYNEFTNTDILSKFISLCKKSEMFFEYCDQTDKYKSILDCFLQKHSCPNWEKFVYTIIKLFIMNNCNEDSFRTITLNPDESTYKEEFSILSNLSININQIIPLDNNVDYKKFRNYPLVQVEKNQFLLISKSLCVEKLYNSLLFNFNEINTSLSKKYQIPNFFQNYTSNFSEEYMFYEVMRVILSKQKYISMSGKECREINRLGEPDYYIRNWNDVFLFEFKDVKMDAETKTSCDYKTLKSKIEDKLVYKKEKTKNSAIYQLTNNIQKILSNTFNWDKKINSSKVNIYPILVVGDSTFTTPGMNCILNDYFSKSLKSKSISRKQVKDLIVIDINTLILYQNEFADKNITIKDTCENYYKCLRMRYPHSNRQTNITQNAFHYLLPISCFIGKNIKQKSSQLVLSALITKIQSKGLE